jgi:hypothetical protein
MLKANRFILKLQDLFSWWWNGECLRTPFEGIEDMFES